MNKAIIEKGKMTDEGRLKIRNIRKGKCYIALVNFFEVLIGMLSGISFVEGSYIIYRMLSGQTSEYGYVFDGFISLFAYWMSFMCFKEMKSMEKEKKNTRIEIKEDEENILSM